MHACFFSLALGSQCRSQRAERAAIMYLAPAVSLKKNTAMGESVQPAGRQLSEDPVYPTRLIVWFQGRDLRLHDNPLLSTAMRHASPKETSRLGRE